MIATSVVPSPKIGKNWPERRLDQDQAGDIGKTAADPVADRRRETGIVAKSGFCVGINAGIQIRLAAGQGLEDESQHQHTDARDHPGDQRAENPCGPTEGRG